MRWYKVAIIIVALLNIVEGLREYRTLNGTGNNLDNPEWGSVQQPYARKVVRNNWPDGIGNDMRLTPGAREISNKLFGSRFHAPGGDFGNMLHAYYGIFMSNDITILAKGGDLIEVPVPYRDPYKDPEGTGTEVYSRFRRSTMIAGT